MAYYYLASSLPELVLQDEFERHPYPVFEEFAREELLEEDWHAMKMCFFLNDAVNIADSLRGGSNGFRIPSYYDRDTLSLIMRESEDSLPFVSDFIREFRNAGERRWNSLPENELVLRTMEYAEDSETLPEFVWDYLEFELRLRNLMTAVVRKSAGTEYAEEIVNFDHASNMIAANPAEDFGLREELNWMDSLLESGSSDSPSRMEQDITRTRWEWLDDRVPTDPFTRENIFSFAIKAADVNRWLSLSSEGGKKAFHSLLEQLQSEISNTFVKES